MGAGYDDLSPFAGLENHAAADGIGLGGIPVVHDFGEVDAEDCRIVAADSLGVGGAALVVPVAAVPQVVVMAEHPASPGNRIEVCQQRLGLPGGILVHNGDGGLDALVALLHHGHILGVIAVGAVGEAYLPFARGGILVLVGPEVTDGGSGGLAGVLVDPVAEDANLVVEVGIDAHAEAALLP